MSDKTKIIAAFSTSIIILVLIGVYSFFAVNNYKISSNWVRHTEDVMSEGQQLFTYLQDIETSGRGYAISGREYYLHPYNNAYQKIDGSFEKLKILTEDNPIQQKLLDSLKPYITKKQEITKNIIDARKLHGFAAAQETILTDVGENSMRYCRSFMRKFNNNENDLLTTRMKETKEGFINVIVTVITSIFISIIFILVALYFYLRDNKIRIKSEREVKESELRLRGFLNALPLGILVVDAKGKAYYANKKSKEILGRDIADNTARNFIRDGHSLFEAGTERPYPLDKMPAVRALQGESEICVEDMEVLKDQKRIPVRINASPVYDSDGNIVYSIQAFEDITEAKLAAQELLKAKQVAEDALLLKEAFLANMSHEIRTPMNAIIGFTDILAKRNLGSQEREYIKAIKGSGENLLRIINDILDISKIEANMMIFEDHPLSIRELFKSLHTMLMSKAQEKKLDLLFIAGTDIPNIVLGDPTRLTQILINLVSNALKFTNKGNITVFANVKTETAEHYHIEFVVKDTGIGIPVEKLQNIFERFRQAEPHTTRNYGGTGLGLSIAKQLVELQGGQISIQSRVNIGSVFTFVIPFKKAIHLQDFKEETVLRIDKDVLSKLKVLLVEDNPINVKLVLSLFAEQGISADEAENGQIALDLLKTKTYDVILMDMEMPVLNGYETTRIIRKEMRSQVPIIAMTAHAMAGEREKCIQLGMDDYISKPISEQILFEKIFKHGAVKEQVLALSSSSEITHMSVPNGEKVSDLSLLVELMRGKKDAIKETLDIFIKQVNDDIPIILTAVEKQDYATIKNYAHRLKSSVSMMGINTLEQIFSEMESLSKVSMNIEKIAQLSQQMKAVFAVALVEIQAEMAQFEDDK